MANSIDITITSRVSLLEPGMWVFRYQNFQGGTTAPFVSLHQSCIGSGSVDFFPAPAVEKNTLTKPGDSIIVRIQGASCGILITEYHLKGQPSKIELRVDRLNDRPTQATNSYSMGYQLDQSFGTSTTTTPISNLSGDPAAIQLELLGHIERRGDVLARNDWLGDPFGSARLEGFVVSGTNLPEGLTLAYSCRGPGDAQPQVSIAGGFVGSRQKAKPITSVAFNIGGVRSGEFELTGEVVFSGQPATTLIAGQELTGPTGREHLVAVRLGIAPKTSNLLSQSPWDDPKITEIFKTS